jgi:uncharacterized protein (TIGR00255 family)
MMTKGMTGFGRAVESDGRYEVTVEISSVNKRHLDVTIRLPKGYQQAELAIRQTLAAHLHRGQVTLSVSIRTLAPSVQVPAVDISQLKEQLSSLRAMAEAVGAPVPLEKALFELWRRQLEETEVEALPEVGALIARATEKAVTDLDRRREDEGKALAKDIQKRLGVLRDLKQKIAEKSVGHVDRIRQRLTELVAKYVPTLASDDRVLREVVLYADKADVSEELARIDHHVEQANKAFATDGPKGKLLEFVLQELLREFNTLGAKTDDAEVSTAVVIAKTELEKMREQVQNVE